MKGGGEVNISPNINIPEISTPMRPSNNTIVTGTNNTFNMPTESSSGTWIILDGSRLKLQYTEGAEIQVLEDLQVSKGEMTLHDGRGTEEFVRVQ